MKNKFGFILVKPQLGENIGACARSMKNFGFNKLCIVQPKISFPNHKAKATSVGAYDIINILRDRVGIILALKGLILVLIFLALVSRYISNFQEIILMN